MKSNLDKAHVAESAGDFFRASFFYKEALQLARNSGDKESILSLKTMLVETNRKSLESFKEIGAETLIPNEPIEKIIAGVAQGDLKMILKNIGLNKNLFPHFKQVETTSDNTTPLFAQLANHSIISPDGHLVKGGTDASYSWFMKMYSLNQGIINELLLKNIFDRILGVGFNASSLIDYLKTTNIFPEENLAIINTGIERYFSGDFISALHVLIPQFENVFMFLSERLGIDIVALNRGKEISTQTKTLSAEYLESEKFQNKWGMDLCEQIKFVLYDQLGYTLRHKICHGYIKKEECSIIEANLIIYLFLVLASRIKQN